jgi:hypothetical protein
MRAHTTFAAALIAVTAAACGPGQPGSGPGDPGGTSTTATGGAAVTQPAASAAGGQVVLDACELLSAQQLKDITGWTVTSAGPTNLATAYDTHCEWKFDEGYAGIVLGLISPGGAEYLDRTVEYEGGTPVAGLGDRAVRTEISDTLLILTGDTVLDLQIIGGDDELDREIAQRVLTNLGA